MPTRDWTVTVEDWPLCNRWIVKTPSGRCFNRFDPVSGRASAYLEASKGPVLDPQLCRLIDSAIEASSSLRKAFEVA